jgi:hypothetical protein
MRTRQLLGTLAAGLALWAGQSARADYASTVLALNPAAYWKLNETAPTPMADVATNLGTLGALGNGYYLGLGGTNLVVRDNTTYGPAPGVFDNDASAVFNGSSSVGLAIPRTSPNLVIRPPFSVELWVFQTNQVSGQGLIADGHNYDLASGVYSGFAVYTAASGAYSFSTYARNSSTAALTITSAATAQGAWHHIVATYTADSVATLYVDNVASTPVTNTYFPSFAPEIQIGSMGSFGTGLDNARFAGGMDEIAIYTNALSASDVAAHFNNVGNYQSLVLTQNPLIYLRLDEPAWTAPTLASLTVATNYGTVGNVGQGYYQPGTLPGMAGPAFSGFGAGNYACAFNGLNAAVDCSNNVALLPTGSGTNNPISLAAWIKTSPADWRFQGICGRGDSSWRFGLNGNSANGNAGWNPGFGSDVSPTTPNVNNGLWHFIVGTLNSSNNTRVLYVDGVQVGIGSGSGTYGAGATNVLIGGAPDYSTTRGLGSVRYFAGTICQVAYFTNALTATQVSNLYNAAGITITVPPVAQAVLQGSNLTLSATAAGPGPLGYQWYRGATPVGGNSSTYTVASAGAGDAGSYTVVVTNATDSITSIAASVTVLAVGPPTSTYATAVMALNPVGFWPLNESAGSAIAVNYGSLSGAGSGLYSYGAVPGVAGPTYVGLGGATACLFRSWGTFVDLGVNPALLPTNRQPMSIVAWFQGPGENRLDSPVGHGDNYWRTTVDTSGFNHYNPGNGAELTGNINLRDTNWHQFVGVSDGTNEWLYLDGSLNQTGAVSQVSTSGPSILMSHAVIGGAPDYGATPNYPVFATSLRCWTGSVAQVAFFSNALSSAQVSNLFGAAGVPPIIASQPAGFTNASGLYSSLGVSVRGSLPAFQWYAGNPGSETPVSNGGNVSGATTPTLVFSPLAAGNASNYFVVVTNAYGAVTSTVVSVGVYGAPPTSGYGSNIMAMNPPPVGYWPLNETTAPPAPYIATNLGTAGSLLNGVYETYWSASVANPTFNNANSHVSGVTAAGDGDTAAVFGSSGQYVVLPHHVSSSVIKTPFSVEAWVYPTSIPTAAGTTNGIVSQTWNNINGSGQYEGFYLGTIRSNWVFALYNTNAQISQEIQITNAMFINTWVHLVGTFDGTSAALYVNGAAITATNGSNPRTLTPNGAGLRFVPDDNSPLLVGCLQSFNNNRFPGYIDEVAIYTNALSSTDVLNHYSNVAGGSYPTFVQANNPLIYLRLDEPAYTAPAASMSAAAGIFPVATNYGSIGLSANGLYQPGTTPGIAGPSFAGMNAAPGVAIDGLAGIEVGGTSLSVNAPLLNRSGTSPQSVVCWFKGTADNNRFQNILGHSDSGWRCAVDGSGFNRFNPGGGSELTGTSRAAGDGQWHMVTGVANGSQDFLYLDGIQVAFGTHSSVVGTTLDVILGGDPAYTTPGTRYFLGSISQVAYYTNALTSNQIQQIYSAAGVPPYIVTQPANVIANAGGAATNTVVPNGSTPFSYQWYKGTPGSGTPVTAGNVSGATTSTIIWNPLAGSGSDAGSYYVVVTNAYGAVTSAVATLTVNTAPTIVSQPPSFILFPGGTCTFTISASGAVPLFYYWKSNGVIIASATNTTLTLTNVQPSYSASYSCMASNFLGTATGTGTLSVVTTSQGYAQTITNDHPIGYWRLGETSGNVAYDWIGANNGTHTNDVLGFAGVNGGDPDGATGFGPTYASQVGNSRIANIPNINFATPNGSSTNFSVECWVKGQPQTLDSGIITVGGGGGGEQFNLDCGGTSHAFRFFVRNAAGGGNGNANATIGPDPNVWHHVVGVCNQTNAGTVSLYVDGVLNGSGSVTSGGGILALQAPMSIGCRQSGSGSAYDLQFDGIVDEVAVYNYPLSATQIAAHYAARQVAPAITQQPPASQLHWLGSPLTFTVAASGSPTIGFQWYRGTPGSATLLSNGGNISGANTASLHLNSVGVSDTSFFAVASNPYGSATSTVATVSVITPPSGTYVQTIIADSPVGYWRLGETNDANFPNNSGVIANDYLGGHNGAYTNVSLEQPGYSAVDTNQAAFFGPTAGSYVGGIPGIGFPITNASGTFSVEAWVNGSAVQIGGAGIVSKGYSGAEQFCLDYNGASGQVGWRFFVRTVAGNTVVANSLTPPDGAWHHLAGVCDEVDGAVKLYVDGQLKASTGVAVTNGIANSALPTIIGSRQSLSGGAFDYQFDGTVDEVAVYNYALTSTQVVNHYFAAGIAPTVTVSPLDQTGPEGGSATFTASAYGTPSYHYQWYDATLSYPGTPLANKTNASLVLNNLSAASPGPDYYYYVVVTNQFGSVESPQVHLLVVGGPPNFAYGGDLPAAMWTYAGRNVTMTVSPAGTVPFTYQWQHAGTNLIDNGHVTGAHTATLNIAGALGTDAGTYQVHVSNNQGAVDSTLGLLYVETVPDFNTNGLGWSVNGTVANITGGLLTLTDNNPHEASSAYYSVPLYIGAFKAFFTYQDVTIGGADGVAFVMQNAGPTAVGTDGGGFGYGGISPSAALEMNIYSGSVGGVGIAFGTNGLTAQNGGAAYTSTSPVNIASGNPIDVALTYLGGQLSVTMTDETTLATYSTSYSVPNLPAIVGGQTAYVGFSGATGGVSATQTVTNFSYLPLATLSVQSSGSQVLISWPASLGGYTLQSTTDFVTWNPIPGPYTLAGGQFQLLVNPTVPKFYRLVVTTF